MTRIEATGCYLPEKIVTNDFFTDESNLFSSIGEYFTGYNERRHASPNENSLSMAREATLTALSESEHCAKDLDLIIGCLVPSDYLYGDDLNLLQHGIGATNASVIPINTTCSTFLSALNIADSLIASGKKKCILIVTAVNWINYGLDTSEPNFAFAGDGAAAVIVDDQSDRESLIDICELNNSTPEIFLSMAMKNPVVTGKKEYFNIIEPEGISMLKDMILTPISVIKKLLARNSEVTIDKVFMHQSGLKMMRIWMNKVDIPFEKVCHTLDLYANMISANIPVSLDYWIRQGGIKRGQNILFFAPAAGGHSIAMLWRY